jgi:histidinol-phosphate aminotransferase
MPYTGPATRGLPHGADNLRTVRRVVGRSPSPTFHGNEAQRQTRTFMAAEDSNFCWLEQVRPHLRDIAGYAPGEQPQGGKFIKLNTNENPYPPSPQALAASADFGERLRKYPDPTATAFRRLAAASLGVTPEQIVCGNGSDEILAMVIRLLLGPEDLAAWASPTYLLYETLVRAQGARWQTFAYTTDWKLPTELYACSPKLAFIANPNSPSGTCFSLDELRAIIERFDGPVLVDEAYADFAGISAASLVDDYPHLMVSRTLSKSYALAGLRFGYLIGHPDLITQIHKIRDSYNCDALSIAIATAAISDQDWLKQNIEAVVSQREWLQTQLTQLGFMVQPSQANFVWCQHPTFPAKSLYEELKKRQILVRYMDYGVPWIGLRITVGTPGQNQVLLEQLTQILA